MIEIALEFRCPFLCAGMLVMCAVDCVCILFTVMLLGRQVVLASGDLTEYEASVLNLPRRRRRRTSWCQAIRDVYWFFFNHRMFLASLSTEGPYPEQEKPDRGVNDVETVNGHRPEHNADKILASGHNTHAKTATKGAHASVARLYAARFSFLFNKCRRMKDPRAEE